MMSQPMCSPSDLNHWENTGTRGADSRLSNRHTHRGASFTITASTCSRGVGTIGKQKSLPLSSHRTHHSCLKSNNTTGPSVFRVATVVSIIAVIFSSVRFFGLNTNDNSVATETETPVSIFGGVQMAFALSEADATCRPTGGYWLADTSSGRGSTTTTCYCPRQYSQDTCMYCNVAEGFVGIAPSTCFPCLVSLPQRAGEGFCETADGNTKGFTTVVPPLATTTTTTTTTTSTTPSRKQATSPDASTYTSNYYYSGYYSYSAFQETSTKMEEGTASSSRTTIAASTTTTTLVPAVTEEIDDAFRQQYCQCRCNNMFYGLRCELCPPNVKRIGDPKKKEGNCSVCDEGYAPPRQNVGTSAGTKTTATLTTTTAAVQEENRIRCALLCTREHCSGRGEPILGSTEGDTQQGEDGMPIVVGCAKACVCDNEFLNPETNCGSCLDPIGRDFYESSCTQCAVGFAFDEIEPSTSTPTTALNTKYPLTTTTPTENASSSSSSTSSSTSKQCYRQCSLWNPQLEGGNSPNACETDLNNTLRVEGRTEGSGCKCVCNGFWTGPRCEVCPFRSAGGLCLACDAPGYEGQPPYCYKKTNTTTAAPSKWTEVTKEPIKNTSSTTTTTTTTTTTKVETKQTTSTPHETTTSKDETMTSTTEEKEASNLTVITDAPPETMITRATEKPPYGDKTTSSTTEPTTTTVTKPKPTDENRTQVTNTTTTTTTTKLPYVTTTFAKNESTTLITKPTEKPPYTNQTTSATPADTLPSEETTNATTVTEAPAATETNTTANTSHPEPLIIIGPSPIWSPPYRAVLQQTSQRSASAAQAGFAVISAMAPVQSAGASLSVSNAIRRIASCGSGSSTNEEDAATNVSETPTPTSTADNTNASTSESGTETKNNNEDDNGGELPYLVDPLGFIFSKMIDFDSREAAPSGSLLRYGVAAVSNVFIVPFIAYLIISIGYSIRKSLLVFSKYRKEQRRRARLHNAKQRRTAQQEPAVDNKSVTTIESSSLLATVRRCVAFCPISGVLVPVNTFAEGTAFVVGVAVFRVTLSSSSSSTPNDHASSVVLGSIALVGSAAVITIYFWALTRRIPRSRLVLEPQHHQLVSPTRNSTKSEKNKPKSCGQAIVSGLRCVFASFSYVWGWLSSPFMEWEAEKTSKQYNYFDEKDGKLDKLLAGEKGGAGEGKGGSTDEAGGKKRGGGLEAEERFLLSDISQLDDNDDPLDLVLQSPAYSPPPPLTSGPQPPLPSSYSSPLQQGSTDGGVINVPPTPSAPYNPPLVNSGSSSSPSSASTSQRGSSDLSYPAIASFLRVHGEQLLGEKRFYFCAFGGLLCSFVVGAAEAISDDYCRIKVIIALVAVVGQAVAGTLALTRLDIFVEGAMGMLNVAMTAAAIVAVFGRYTGGGGGQSQDMLVQGAEDALDFLAVVTNIFALIALILTLIGILSNIVEAELSKARRSDDDDTSSSSSDDDDDDDENDNDKSKNQTSTTVNNKRSGEPSAATSASNSLETDGFSNNNSASRYRKRLVLEDKDDEENAQAATAAAAAAAAVGSESNVLTLGSRKSRSGTTTTLQNPKAAATTITKNAERNINLNSTKATDKGAEKTTTQRSNSKNSSRSSSLFSRSSGASTSSFDLLMASDTDSAVLPQHDNHEGTDEGSKKSSRGGASASASAPMDDDAIEDFL